MTSDYKKKVAYFSMEYAIDARIPNFAGGLGVLAADIMHSAADTGAPIIGVSLIYHQHDDPTEVFPIEKYMKKRTEVITVRIQDRDVKVGCYEYSVQSHTGNSAPIFFLTTYLPENAHWDRNLTRYLYASDQYTRICQELILGVGGVRMLRALGYGDIDCFHMNEGHAAFLTFELLRETNYSDAAVRKQCTFTTHTPIPAGHDAFEYGVAGDIIREMIPWHVNKIATEERLSMTHLALNLSKYSNSVSEKHREVCREMFSKYEFSNVTNGVHPVSWASPAMAKLFDRYIPGWKDNPALFIQASKLLPDKEVIQAHRKNKQEFVKWVNSNRDFFPIKAKLIDDDFFDEDTLTITFARRFVPYKRPSLVFQNIDRLRDLGYRKLQIIFAGRCHPDDKCCMDLKRSLQEYGRRLRGQIRVAVVRDYEIDIAKMLVSGSDVWLNNPIKPREASGTSGMKAALNGLPNLSVLDGWWNEGYRMNPKAGWPFGDRSNFARDEATRDRIDADELYDVLKEVIEAYDKGEKNWVKHMKAAISLIGQFNTHRVIDEYYQKMWGRD